MSKLIIRDLQKEDLWNGFLASLDSLRETGSMKRSKAEKVFEKVNSNKDHIIAVAKVDGRVVGAATLLIEQKFIHDGGLAGHIEDVAVSRKFQGRGIGEKIIRHLLEESKNRGCYKTVLHCTDSLRPYYEKIGFQATANGMRYDHA